MATILITGGTGMIGKKLTSLLLLEGHNVIILTRNLPENNKTLTGLSYAQWDVAKQTIDPVAVENADHIIHLAGAGVADERWSAKRKQEIVDSRVKGCQLIVKALSETNNKVQTVVSASAIGWYGPDTAASRAKGFTEGAPVNKDFLGETCRLWEESIEPVTGFGKRLVKLRTGIVLSEKGGALAEFKKPLKARVATILGDGQQVVSWIHVDDLCRMYLYAINNTALQGAYNAVAPEPVTNAQLIASLARQIYGKKYVTVKVPAFALRIALGEMSVEVLKSATVSAEKIEGTGFVFRYADIDSALAQLV